MTQRRDRERAASLGDREAVGHPHARLVLVLLCAAWLRLHALGRESFWLDEAYTWYLMLPSWRDSWGVMLLISDTSPLYYVVARLTTPLIGQSEFALRFVALTAGLLAIPVVYRIGKSMLGREIGLWAAWLLAFSPFAVWYARDARPYGFYLLFAALALWGFWRWAEQGRGPRLFVLSSAALYLTHYASALFAFAQVGYLLTPWGFRRDPLRFRRWFGWQALAALPTGLYLLAFLLRRQPVTGNAWIPRAGLLAPLQTLLNFLSADADRPTWTGVLLALAGAVAFGEALSSSPKTGSRDNLAKQLLLWWLFLPMFSVWLLSFRLPAYIDRFFTPELIALVLLLGAGLARRAANRRVVRFVLYVCAAILCGGMLFASLRLLAGGPRYAKEDWRGAAQFIAARYPRAPLLAQDGEVLLGLLPYRASAAGAQRASPERVEAADRLTVVVLRSPHDTNHGLSKSAPFDPLVESPLADWLMAHPERIVAAQRFVGVGVVIVGP